MKNRKLLLAIIMLGIGFLGILSILTMEIPLPPEVEAALEDLSPFQQKILLLINPTVMLLIGVIIGTVFYEKVDLGSPILEKLVGLEQHVDYSGILRFGILGGLLSGILLSLVSILFIPHLPNEFLELGETLKPSLAARFLYGGLTEEILMRFGLMTLLVWIASKLFKGTRPFVYWIGIVISALLFALGHFPIAFQAVADPSIGLLSYILIGNTIGGIIFGWLYWKKGLESAFLAHIFAHVVMVLAEPLMS